MFPDPAVLPAVHVDPFAPVLMASTPVTISAEQEDAVRRLLLLTSSDTNFAQKAADALRVILGGGVNQGAVPAIASLVPAQKGMGSQTFQLRVLGSKFENGAIIYINGNAFSTTFVAANEVKTDLNLQSVTAPAVYPVLVRNPAGASSNTLNFQVTAGLVTFSAKEGPVEQTEPESITDEEVKTAKEYNPEPTPEKAGFPKKK